MKDIAWLIEVLISLMLTVVSGFFVVCGIMNLFTYGVDWLKFIGAIVVLIVSCYWTETLMEG
ncbi:MAG TPA: hypothetical protein DHU75_09345 [Rikenellaceae bacterium]|nr:hypothetical protein [Rikenellaceae bacterium]